MLLRNAIFGFTLLSFSGIASALEVGFEGLLAVNVSDNVSANNSGEEVNGKVGYGQFGVYGSKEGGNVKAGFAGEIYTVNEFGSADVKRATTVTNFTGAAEWQITPKALSWYFGDILGGIRASDALQPIDDLADIRRNVFVTGPQLDFEVGSFSRIKARFLYVDQSQDNVDLEKFYNSSASWQHNSRTGSRWGFDFSGIYTDNPQSSFESDINRLAVTGNFRRKRGIYTYSAQLGATRYTTVIEQLLGGNGELKLTRELGDRSSMSVALSRDLRDQGLNTVEELVTQGTGIAQEGNGFFDETQLELIYNQKLVGNNLKLSLGLKNSDFRLLEGNAGLSSSAALEDKSNVFASAIYTVSLTPRTKLNSSLRFEEQEFDNKVDTTKSYLATLQLIHKLSRSFEVRAGYRGIVGDGVRTNNNSGPTTAGEIIDVAENRFTLGLRWAPPTRATKELTVQLKSLLK